MNRYRCTSCKKISAGLELLQAVNPFDPTDAITGCPHCKQIDNFDAVCDEPGCDETVCGGWPSEAGYRLTCSKHWNKKVRVE